jgi:serine/threonine protein kinase
VIPRGREGLHPFAFSRVDAVGKLHQAGPLVSSLTTTSHVSASAKTASLLDVGHAQEEGDDAMSHTGTVGFTAPEVVHHGAPHSRVTDASSVGRSLQHACDHLFCEGAKEEHSIIFERRAAALLSSADPRNRIPA